MPAVPRWVNAPARIIGRNSRTRFIMAVLESELLSSELASDRNCLSNTILRAPVLDDSIIFGSMYARFLRQVYAYGPKTSTAFGPTSRLPSALTIQCGSRNGYSGCLGTEYIESFVRSRYCSGACQYSPRKCRSV